MILNLINNNTKNMQMAEKQTIFKPKERSNIISLNIICLFLVVPKISFLMSTHDHRKMSDIRATT